ncbi:hypothetical protein MTR_0054s0010 [Medicago truncatula]|uniref:Response regulatory domain-containing protein n=1 Tax=Medicago truncatula TaxID=3880 RepID=A0A072THW5_MEDTR|nr:hypothetical protein MTR_0054s0010 [Medicago truncatula]
MNGFEFQKQIQDEFELPDIVMSKDNTPDIVSMTLELGAAHYIVNAFCTKIFRDIWKYALEAKKNKLFIDSLSAAIEKQETSTDILQTKKKCSKKKSCDYSQDEGEFEIKKVKKSKEIVSNDNKKEAEMMKNSKSHDKEFSSSSGKDWERNDEMIQGALIDGSP